MSRWPLLALCLLLAPGVAAAGPQDIFRAQAFGPTAALEKTSRALDAPTSLEFIETPLADIVQFLRDLHGIEIRMDLPAMEQAKISPDCAVTADIAGVSLRSALRVALPTVGLTYVVQSDCLLITTPKAARSRLVANSYPIGNLVDPGRAGQAARLQSDALASAVAATVWPHTWWRAGGRGTIAALPPARPEFLTVTQVGAVQDEVLQLLGRLHGAAGGGPAIDPAVEKLYKALESPTTLDFVETPLSDVKDYLQDLHGIVIQFDTRSMTAAGIPTDVPVTEQAKGVPLDGILQRILQKTKLACVIEDEVLLITTPREAQKRRPVAVYALDAELARRLVPGAKQPAAEAVIGRITASIAPKSWQPSGGRGVAAAVTVGKRDVLIVRQTSDVQRQIARLLERRTPEQPKPTKAKPPNR